MSRWHKVTDFLGLRRNTALLLVALVFAGAGEKLWIGFVPKYMQTLGATVIVIGLFDALQTLLGALYAYPGGWLTDYWGQRRSLMLFSALSLGGYVVVLVWHHWLAVVLGAFLFLAWSAFSLPTTFTVIATSLKQHQHTMGVGVQSMVRRVPMMMGPLIGGWLITRFGWQEGIRLSLLCCIGLGTLTMIFQWWMVDEAPSSNIQAPAAAALARSGAPREKLQSASSKTDGFSFVRVVKSFNPTLRELLVSDILIRFCERLPYAFVILWAMNHAGVNAEQFGVLTAIEMITAMLCYIPVAHLADKYGQQPFVLATFVFFTLFPISLIWADNFGWLAVAFVIRGLKEFGEPARKALIIAQAQPELRSRTYGAYYLIRDCIVTSGSFLGAWLWSIGPRANFIGAAILGGSGALWFWWLIQRSRPVTVRQSPTRPVRERSKTRRVGDRRSVVALPLLGCSAFCLHAGEALRLSRTIPLPDVQGRIDHLAIDPQGQRLFIAALGNNTLEVIDLRGGKVIHSLHDCSKPQGVLYLVDSNQIFVANGEDGTLKIFDGGSYKLIKSIGSLADADNLRYYAEAKRIYVGYGDGALGVIDEATGKLTSSIKLESHPESFQLEKDGSHIFVNVPDAKQVAVIDRKKQSVQTVWPMQKFQANFPMALDEPDHCLFIGCRKPPRVVVLDSESGKQIAELPIGGDTDDLFYDQAHKRLYVSCGEGFIDVIAQKTGQSYERASRIATVAEARTSLFSPDLDQFYLAVPVRGKQTAEIIVYDVAN